MCGIAAISSPKDSKVNARALTHALLTQIEKRGSHASGFAYIDADGSMGIYKAAKPGSQLPLHELPRTAKAVVIHTRYATQGHQSNNSNNHPVISTDRRIALVHNGVISNDHKLRPELGLEKEHGLVDSLVIPSLIAQQGIDSMSKLAGYAAVAWLDATDTEGAVNIARLKSSPVSYTHLYDGTFVMASTENLLEAALATAKLDHGGVFDLAEGRMISVVNGFIDSHDAAPKMTYDSYSYTRYSSSTAGGHSTTTYSRATGKGSEDAPKVTTDPVTASGPACNVYGVPIDDDGEIDVEGYLSDLDEWRQRRAAEDAIIVGKAMAMYNGGDSDDEDYPGDDIPQDDWTTAQWDAYVARLEREEAAPTMDYLNGEGFYILDAEGDISHYPTLDDLEGHLRWIGKMTRSEFDLFQDLDESMNWVNHIMDLGAVDDDGELISWVDDMADIDEYESPAVRNLQHIREGVGFLMRLKGA